MKSKGKHHVYGDGWKHFDTIEYISHWIGDWLAVWAGMSVLQCKEKFGGVRVYCTFGLRGSKSNFLDKIIIPIQERMYISRYKQAIKKWPHLKHEILQDADFGELFEGKIKGYKHAHYWRIIK